MPTASNDQAQPELTKRLLARTPVIQNACDLDLLLFLHRHPRALLTTEQLAGFVGYNLKDVAKALDAFIEAGLLVRTAQQSVHAARMFVLLLNGTQAEGVRALLDLATTRAGRQSILEALEPHRISPDRSPDLKLVKRA